MLIKCLKYDLKAIVKVWWIIAFLTLGMGFVGGVCKGIAALITVIDPMNYLIAIVAAPFSIAGGICFFGVCLTLPVTLLLVYIRYYKNFFTDEGYLTFTLPVKRSTLFASKIISSGAWYTIQTVLVVVAILMIILLGSSVDIISELFSDPTTAPSTTTSETATSFLSDIVLLVTIFIVIPIEGIVITFLSMMHDMLLVHFCITFGAVIVKRAKILMGIGIYFVVNGIVMALTQFASWIAIIMMLGGVSQILTASAWQVCIVFAAVLAFVAVTILVPVCVLYLISLHLIERKLNLA